jgi:bla regulator protein BlaR1
MVPYILKSILCSGILILFYYIFLEREKMHKVNRFYLLTSVLFSLIIPIIPLSITSEAPAIAQRFTLELTTERANHATDSAPMPGIPPSGDLPLNIAVLLYASVTILLLIRFTKSIQYIWRQKSSCKTVGFHGANLVLVPQDIGSYTFLNNIFVSEKAFAKNQIRPEVLIHELTHVKQKHSLDILFIELAKTLFWVNPLLFIYKKAIRLNHEFLADEAVLQKFKNTRKYQLLLLDAILHTKNVRFASSFNFSITKKRLDMMTTTTSRTLLVSKQFAASLLILGLTFVFSEKNYSQTTDKVRSNIQTKNQHDIGKQPKGEVETIKTSIGERISPQEMDEFNTLIKQNSTSVTTSTGHTDLRLKLTVEQKKRLFSLFQKMNKSQQQDTGLSFFEMPIPVKRAPTADIFELWKNPAVFGVWIDNKRVSNKELEKYKSSDIAEYDLSKLYGKAKTGRSYKYQLDLTTNAEFDKTYQARVNDRILISTIHRFAKQ